MGLIPDGPFSRGLSGFVFNYAVTEQQTTAKRRREKPRLDISSTDCELMHKSPERRDSCLLQQFAAPRALMFQILTEDCLRVGCVRGRRRLARCRHGRL